MSWTTNLVVADAAAGASVGSAIFAHAAHRVDFLTRVAEANAVLQPIAYIVAIVSGVIAIWFHVRHRRERS